MPQPIKMLTVHQPWAWAIAAGHKPIENRSWSTRHRGDLVIHAGRSRASLEDGRRYVQRLGIVVPSELIFGAAIAIVRLRDCVPVSDVLEQPFAEGPYCWLLDRVRPIRPVYCSGGQGLIVAPAGLDETGSRLVGVEPPPPIWTMGMLPLH